MSTKKIAIDGPAGAGKSTIAKRLAVKLGYIYVDTGAMYRAVALSCIRAGISTDDEAGVTAQLKNISIDIAYDGGAQQIYLCGENVSESIRTPEVSMGASNVSRFLGVREMLVDYQRKIAEKHNVIMDGRDIATKVLPDADAAVFLTADVKERAKRRYDELILKGDNVNFDDVLEDMKRRDKNDSTRANSPLVKAENAVLADTTGKTLDESEELVFNIIREKVGEI